MANLRYTGEHEQYPPEAWTKDLQETAEGFLKHACASISDYWFWRMMQVLVDGRVNRMEPSSDADGETPYPFSVVASEILFSKENS